MTDDSSSKVPSNNVALWTTYINIALYAMCYQLQRPVEPFLVQNLSKNGSDGDQVAQTYGSLQAFFSVIQTVGSPLVGILLDRLGIRKTSAMIFLASAASYGILTVATDMNFLFYSKIPTALQHAFLVAQATAATSTVDDTARAQALGRMTTAYTIGATVGPALGGRLADQGDLYIGAKLAVIGSLVSVVLSILFLPNVVSNAKMDTKAPEKKRSFVDELRHSGEIAVRAALWPLLLVKVVGGVTASMHSTTLPIVLTQNLNFDPAQLGINMSASNFAIAGFGAVCMAPLTRILGTSGMARIGLLLRAFLGLVIAAIVSSASESNEQVRMQVIMTSVLHALASHSLANGLTTATTGAVSSEEQGALLGLEHGLFSLARVGGPPLGTALLALAGFWLVETACGLVDVVMLTILITTASQLSVQKSKSK